MTVTFHHNGLVFNANYAIEYTIRNNEEECEKQPLVKCIFISTDKVITMNGNSTVPCPGKFYAKIYMVVCVQNNNLRPSLFSRFLVQ